MTETDERTDAPSAGERRQARLAQIEAEQERGRQLAERYGHDKPRQRFAVVGYAATKRPRR